MQNSQHTSFPIYSCSPAPFHPLQELPYERSSLSQRHYNKHPPLGFSSISYDASSRVRPPVPPFPRRETRLPPSILPLVSTFLPDSPRQGQAQNPASRTRMSPSSVVGTSIPRVHSGASSPEVHMRPSHPRRQISGSSAVTSSSSGSDASTPRTPFSPSTHHLHSWFASPLQSSSRAKRARHPPPQAPRLIEPAPHCSYPDSRPPYPEVYNLPIPHLYSGAPQGPKLTDSFTATQTAYVDDGEGMGPFSVLHLRAIVNPTEREQAPDVAMEDIRIDDGTVAVMTQSQSQPQLTSSDGLLGVNTGSSTEVIQRPASAPPDFPQTGLESDQHNVDEEAPSDVMDDLCYDRVGRCLPTTSTVNHFASQPAPATRDYDQDQGQPLIDLARMHNFIPRPELCPFPDSHPYLYYLFPPPPTAALIIQSVVHPSLVPVNSLSKVSNSEITGTRGRRTAWSERGAMKAGEVKGPMYENVPLIDIRTGVVHYPGAGHTSVMTGGVRIGSCAEEEREVMELLEMMEIDECEEAVEKVDREDAWVTGPPIPERPMPHLPSTPTRPLLPRLFDHQHQYHGYAYASPPSSPVHARRPTLAQFEYSQAAAQQQQQHTAGMVQPLQPPIQLSSPLQHRRPSSHLANEYILQHQHQPLYACTIEEPTPKTRRVYGYRPGFPSTFSPAVYAVPTSTPPPPSSPAPYMPPALPSYVQPNPYTPQPSPGPYVWYGVNAYTPVAEANTNGYFRPPSVAAFTPPAPPALCSAERTLATNPPDAYSTPQVFYTAQELAAHFLKDPVLSVPSTPVLQERPARPRRGIQRAVGKQATIGLDGTISQSEQFGTPEPEPPEELHSQPDPVAAAGIERPQSVPPILEDDAVNVEVEVEATGAGARANRKRKRDQLAWDYRDENGSSGDGGKGKGKGGEGMSDDEALLSVDERKRARIGHCGSTRRRSFGDDKKRPGSAMRTRLGY